MVFKQVDGRFDVMTDVLILMGGFSQIKKMLSFGWRKGEIQGIQRWWGLKNPLLEVDEVHFLLLSGGRNGTSLGTSL